MLFSSNTRIQGTLSSDVLWLEHSSLMYKSCVKIPLCLWVRFGHHTFCNGKISWKCSLSPLCRHCCSLSLSCATATERLLCRLKHFGHLVCKSPTNRCTGTAEEQEQAAKGKRRQVLSQSGFGVSLFGEWRPVSNMQPNAGECYHHQTTHFSDAGSVLKLCN